VRLKTLNLYRNVISNFPAVSLPSLHTLDVGRNKLSESPQLCGCPLLDKLCLYHNKIATLRKGTLPPLLRELWLDGTRSKNRISKP
jgi:Leucine-rich repeat (LRR) protein